MNSTMPTRTFFLETSNRLIVSLMYCRFTRKLNLPGDASTRKPRSRRALQTKHFTGEKQIIQIIDSADYLS